MENNLDVHNTHIISLPFTPYLGIYPTEVKTPFLKDICTRISTVCDGENKIRKKPDAPSENYINETLWSQKKNELDICLMTQNEMYIL